MPHQERDRDVQQFLREHLESYEQVLSLLAIAKQPDTLWSAELLAGVRRTPLTTALATLQHLARGRLVIEAGPAGDSRFTYSKERVAVVERLDAICVYEPHLVLKWMNAHALERVRSEALKTFADAFLLGRKKPNG